jgi:4a-hydroxytetrahydrobiopterin dehydratase
MWIEKDNQLCRSFSFTDFRQAFLFMTQVAEVAEAHNHHPWWSNVYNQVDIRLTTHDAGDVVTDKDRRLAEAIDLLWEEFPNQKTR